jgi:hypothetical protein
MCDHIPTPLADKEREEFLAFDGGSAAGATLGYHWARMIEMLHAAETIKDLLHDDDIVGSDLMATGVRQERGVGVIEAPRGTLIHHYRVDENDQVIRANLIVSTTHNNQAMNTAVREVAKQYLDGVEVTEGLLNHIEIAIRAFDPCLSCATHALGQMPLEVAIVGADGTVIDEVTRNAAASFVTGLDRADADLRLGQSQPRRRCAGAAVRRAFRGTRGTPSRVGRVDCLTDFQLAGRTRPRPAGTTARALRRCQPRCAGALFADAHRGRARRQLHHPRHEPARPCSRCMSTSTTANRHPAGCWRYAASASNLAKASVANDHNDPIVVAADIEHGIRRNIICTAKALSQISKVPKARMLGDGVRVAQRLLGFRMPVPEVTQHLQ